MSSPAAVDRLLIAPRWGGRPRDAFYPWLERRLGEMGWRGAVDPIALRPPDAPELAASLAALRGRLGADARAARTVLLGHSVGAQAVLRTVATLPAGVEVAGLVLVAAWWTIDRPWPEIQQWIDTPLDWSRVRAAARRIVVLLSTDDPFTVDTARTRRLFDERLGAEVRVHDRAGHFVRDQEPAVLAATAELLGVG